jgi:adenylate cyclase
MQVSIVFVTHNSIYLHNIPLVNTASRIEGLNKEYETSILVSETIHNVVSQNKDSDTRYLFRPLDCVKLKGKGIPILVFELKGLLSEHTDQQRKDCEHFEYGLQAYIDSQFECALDHFRQIEDQDRATVIKIQECEDLVHNVPTDWNFVKVMYSK